MANEYMISVEESNQIISKTETQLQTENVSLVQSMGRILAQPVIADVDQPPFHKSAMDGYACKRADLALPMKVAGIIAAGTLISKTVHQGECYRIFTGAPVPEGADCVIMQEDTSIDSHGDVVFNAQQTRDNICFRGEDSKTGDMVLNAGTKINARHLAIMAGNGIINPLVYKKALITLLCSGSELVEPNHKPEGASIRNSNASQLIGQLVHTGAEVSYKGIVPDNFDAVCKSIDENIESSDVIIITGGASIGDFDFIPEALKKLGAEIFISALNIQPGKPVLYAQLKNKHILGLSGNPVSSFIQYKLVAEPLILRISGANTYLPVIVQIPVSSEISRKKGNRQLYTPVKISSEGIAEPLPFQGSAHIGALSEANGFVILQPEKKTIPAHELATVILI